MQIPKAGDRNLHDGYALLRQRLGFLPPCSAADIPWRGFPVMNTPRFFWKSFSYVFVLIENPTQRRLKNLRRTGWLFRKP